MFSSKRPNNKQRSFSHQGDVQEMNRIKKRNDAIEKQREDARRKQREAIEKQREADRESERLQREADWESERLQREADRESALKKQYYDFVETWRSAHPINPIPPEPPIVRATMNDFNDVIVQHFPPRLPFFPHHRWKQFKYKNAIELKFHQWICDTDCVQWAYTVTNETVKKDLKPDDRVQFTNGVCALDGNIRSVNPNSTYTIYVEGKMYRSIPIVSILPPSSGDEIPIQSYFSDEAFLKEPIIQVPWASLALLFKPFMTAIRSAVENQERTLLMANTFQNQFVLTYDTPFLVLNDRIRSRDLHSHFLSKEITPRRQTEKHNKKFDTHEEACWAFQELLTTDQMRLQTSKLDNVLSRFCHDYKDLQFFQPEHYDRIHDRLTNDANDASRMTNSYHELWKSTPGNITETREETRQMRWIYPMALIVERERVTGMLRLVRCLKNVFFKQWGDHLHAFSTEFFPKKRKNQLLKVDDTQPNVLSERVFLKVCTYVGNKGWYSLGSGEHNEYLVAALIDQGKQLTLEKNNHLTMLKDDGEQSIWDQYKRRCSRLRRQ